MCEHTPLEISVFSGAQICNVITDIGFMQSAAPAQPRYG